VISFNEEEPVNWVDLFAAGPATLISWTSSYSETEFWVTRNWPAPKKETRLRRSRQTTRALVKWFKDRRKTGVAIAIAKTDHADAVESEVTVAAEVTGSN